MQRALTKMRRLVDRSEFTLANFQRDSRLPGQGGQNLLGPSQLTVLPTPSLFSSTWFYPARLATILTLPPLPPTLRQPPTHSPMTATLLVQTRAVPGCTWQDDATRVVRLRGDIPR